MELSVFIARIVAVIYLAASLGGFINPEHYRRLVHDLYDNAALTYLTGFIATIFGLLIIGYHNLWVADWRVLITIIGWLAMLKGLIFIVFPKLSRRMAEPFFSGAGIKAFPYITLAFGLVFAYFGFVHGGV